MLAPFHVRAATRAWIRSFVPGPGAAALLEAARPRGPAGTEISYVAVDLVSRHRAALPEQSLPELRGLALHVPWWDTVDAWATLIGRVGLRPRRGTRASRAGRGTRTPGRGDPFVRKAIGWALRDAARTHPDEVRAFVAEHRGRMSGLSVREALKHL